MYKYNDNNTKVKVIKLKLIKQQTIQLTYFNNTLQILILMKNVYFLNYKYKFIKRILHTLICVCLFISFINYYPNSAFANTNQNTYNYIGNITCYTLNPLVAFPNTFSKHNINNNLNFTYSEFEKLLEIFYNDNFILVNSDLLTPKNIQDNKVKISIPINKKPLILNFKNLDYSNKNTGFIDKYIIDRNNEISTYTKQEYIHERVSSSNDFINIIENFIKLHHDFSYKNARVNLIVNGDKGFLGYEIQQTNDHFKYEQRKLSKVTRKLRNLGYNFIYGGYNSNLNLTNQSFNSIKSDFDLYKKYCTKVTEKNNYIYTSYSNINHYKNLLNQNYITFIEDDNFKTYKEDNLVILTTKVLTPYNINKIV